MKNIALFILVFLRIPESIAGEWIAVGNGAIEIKLNNIEMENNLWTFLEKKNDYTFQSRNTYTYQYQVKTKEELYINAFCESLNTKNLHKEIIMVFDGGSCFFQATFNLKTGKFTKLEVNGEA